MVVFSSVECTSNKGRNSLSWFSIPTFAIIIEKNPKMRRVVLNIAYKNYF